MKLSFRFAFVVVVSVLAWSCVNRGDPFKGSAQKINSPTDSGPFNMSDLSKSLRNLAKQAIGPDGCLKDIKAQADCQDMANKANSLSDYVDSVPPPSGKCFKGGENKVIKLALGEIDEKYNSIDSKGSSVEAAYDDVKNQEQATLGSADGKPVAASSPDVSKPVPSVDASGKPAPSVEPEKPVASVAPGEKPLSSPPTGEEPMPPSKKGGDDGCGGSTSSGEDYQKHGGGYDHGDHPQDQDGFQLPK